jgi:hypothetical protein
MDLREIGWEDVDWIHVVQDRDQWHSCKDCNESLGFIKEREFLDWLNSYNLLRNDLLHGTQLFHYIPLVLGIL